MALSDTWPTVLEAVEYIRGTYGVFMDKHKLWRLRRMGYLEWKLLPSEPLRVSKRSIDAFYGGDWPLGEVEVEKAEAEPPAA
ncbi:hypothetical protein SAMN05444161_5587 [Rhizobiales bacterium GAS191]|nr:hypothetical protein SAMN05444161_5587 [Rhizobiales bacterium GAS191]